MVERFHFCQTRKEEQSTILLLLHRSQQPVVGVGHKLYAGVASKTSQRAREVQVLISSQSMLLYLPFISANIISCRKRPIR
jgi:hypothetical protein